MAPVKRMSSNRSKMDAFSMPLNAPPLLQYNRQCAGVRLVTAYKDVVIKTSGEIIYREFKLIIKQLGFLQGALFFRFWRLTGYRCEYVVRYRLLLWLRLRLAAVFLFSKPVSNMSLIFRTLSACCCCAPGLLNCMAAPLAAVSAIMVFLRYSVGRGFRLRFFNMASSTFSLYRNFRLPCWRTSLTHTLVPGYFCFKQGALIVGDRENIGRIVGYRVSEY